MTLTKKLLPVIFILLFAGVVFATTAYIRPPILSYTVYVIEGPLNTFPGSIEVKNLNSFPVTVVFDTPTWINMVDSVQLQQNEMQDVPFTIELIQSGTFNGALSAAYTAQGKFTAAASSDITVNAILNGSMETTTTTTVPTTTTTTLPGATTTTLPGATTTTVPGATTTTTQPSDDGPSVTPGGSSATTTTTTTTVPGATTTTIFGATTTTVPETTTTIVDSGNIITGDAITVSVLEGPSATEIAIVIIVAIATAFGAVFILRR